MKALASSEILKSIEDQPRIDPQVGTWIHNPELFAINPKLGPIVQRSQPVEAESVVSIKIAETLTPKRDDDIEKFFSEWLEQEGDHGDSQAVVLETIGLEPMPTIDRKTSAAIYAAGIIARASKKFRNIAMVGVLTYMAIGEDEVLSLYPKMRDELFAKGETDLVNGLFTPMIDQETLHKSFQVTAAREQIDEMEDWQVGIVGAYIEEFYRPVSVQRHNKQRMRDFGQMAVTLSPGDPLAPARRAEHVAAKLLNMAPESSGFLQLRYQECINEFRNS